MSYFRPDFDTYWVNIYMKPWTRLPGYLLGVHLGTSYFSYKYDREPQGPLTKMFLAVTNQKAMTTLSLSVGTFLMFMMTAFCKICLEGDGPTTAWTSIYLLTSRPVFVLGFSLVFMPLLLESKLLKPLTAFLSHSWFAPYARLSLGVFLCNTIFMQFDTFNLVNGRQA